MPFWNTGGDDPAEQREKLAERLAGRDRVDDDAVAAIRSVPRHEFVPDRQRRDAYADRPLPIGEGQTISAPHMVAIMASLLDLQPGDDVLEIGTGCGYHAAVTAELVGVRPNDVGPGSGDERRESAGDGHVYSVEYHDSLAEEARERLADLGYDGVSVRAGDGERGWPEHAPYDRAYLTCAAPEFPDAVVEQVRPGGLVLGPIGTGRQTLVRARKRADGGLDREDHGGVRFVEMQ